MKKYLLLLFASVLVLTACGSDDKVLSEDLMLDIEQVLPIIEEVHKNQKEYSERDSNLLDSFYSKYKKGQYYIDEDDEYYEMNDLEKAIFHEINTMWTFSIESDFEMKNPSLASEKSISSEYYDEAKETLDKLMKIKNIGNLPVEFKGKYPTYEIVTGFYPEQFEKDLIELIDLYDPILNGNETDVSNDEWYPLEEFINAYKGDNEYVPLDYEQDNKHYLINSFMDKAIRTFDALMFEIDEGRIDGETIERFNSIKEDVKMYIN